MSTAGQVPYILRNDCQNSEHADSVPTADTPGFANLDNYASRLAAEISIYEECVDVHALPAIFDYWSESYLRPLFSQFGFGSPKEMFTNHLEELCASSSGPSRFVSLGSGNGFMEVAIASQLMAKGYSQFAIECFDLNPKMLGRGAAAAEKAGVSEKVLFKQGDLNDWNPKHEYDAIIADQSLHHVVCLENLFDRVKESLKAEGSFLISDMIGRNGHQRWPEALTLVHEFWRKLPPSYRYNRSLKRYEELYENWDCSLEGFEGIRSQDILPLLLERFQFRLFLGFGNIIDPFIDRAFGPNFDAAARWDQSFIDGVHLRDQQCLLSGRVKPTHMLAVVGKNIVEPPLIYQSLTPESCVRTTRQADIQSASTHKQDSTAAYADFYEWNAWPHNPHRELEFAYGMFKESNRKISDLEDELKKRTTWALRLEKDFEERTAWALRLEKDFEERTAWALRLDEELKIRDKQIVELQQYLNDPLRCARRSVSLIYERAKKAAGEGVRACQGWLAHGKSRMTKAK